MSGFNIDDYLNDPDFENKLENYREKMIFEAIEHNFKNIKENGLSSWHLREMTHTNLVGLKETLIFMTKHFIDNEEYEKCGMLKKELEKIEEILQRVEKDI
jgi:hypothetical protein|tara:strand:- start:8 stop:310 length:303 start_codon:yes stop_codon:yes gene_type:complete